MEQVVVCSKLREDSWQIVRQVYTETGRSTSLSIGDKSTHLLAVRLTELIFDLKRGLRASKKVGLTTMNGAQNPAARKRTALVANIHLLVTWNGRRLKKRIDDK